MTPTHVTLPPSQVTFSWFGAAFFNGVGGFRDTRPAASGRPSPSLGWRVSLAVSESTARRPASWVGCETAGAETPGWLRGRGHGLLRGIRQAGAATLVGLPALTEAAGPALTGASRDLIMAGQALTPDFTATEPARRGTRHAGLRDVQPGGEILVAFRDSFNGERATRARLATTRWIEASGTYGLHVTSQIFGA